MALFAPPMTPRSDRMDSCTLMLPVDGSVPKGTQRHWAFAYNRRMANSSYSIITHFKP